jgi:hypothetical protein
MSCSFKLSDVLTVMNNQCSGFDFQHQPVKSVRSQFLTAASMKIAAFCDLAPCSLVEVDRRTAVRTSETSVYLNETTRRCITEDCNLHQLVSLLLESKNAKYVWITLFYVISVSIFCCSWRFRYY